MFFFCKFFTFFGFFYISLHNFTVPLFQIHDNWDKRIQGIILSSFFIGHALALVPADLILRRVDGKAALTTIQLVNGALSFALPTIINKVGSQI